MSKIGIARAMFKNMKLPITCSICGKPIRFREDLTVDHITPRSKGGRSSLDNLQPAHKICNEAKGATMEYQA
jgi:5-methylcytosine-specific restriction endonuclease McrA